MPAKRPKRLRKGADEDLPVPVVIRYWLAVDNCMKTVRGSQGTHRIPVCVVGSA
jgi:hypothetical protein